MRFLNVAIAVVVNNLSVLSFGGKVMRFLVEYIMIAEQFPAYEVSRAIGISGSEVVNAGDIIRHGESDKVIRVETDTSITYTTGYIETLEMERAIDVMFDMLNDKKDIIKHYIEKYDLCSKFCIVLCLTDNPIMYMPKRFI